MDDCSGDLLVRWRAGDQQAAAELVHRYTARLVALARSRMPAQLSRRVDPEDVVQSVYRSFFAGAADGNYDLSRGGDLWRLLVTITLHKLYHQVELNTAAKRALGRERDLGADGGADDLPAHLATREPSPIEVVALTDELELLMRLQRPLERRILELRLQGHSLEEIAGQTERSLRTVCRVLEQIKQQVRAPVVGSP